RPARIAATPHLSPPRKPGSIDTSLWNIGPGFRGGDSRARLWILFPSVADSRILSRCTLNRFPTFARESGTEGRNLSLPQRIFAPSVTMISHARTTHPYH